MFTIAADESLKTKSGLETVFVYANEFGESIFQDLDVKHEDRDDKGNLIETHYLGWPLEVSAEQAQDWRRVLKHFYEVKARHYRKPVETGDQLNDMARKNPECLNACMEYARVQSEMRDEQVARQEAWMKRLLEKREEVAEAA